MSFEESKQLLHQRQRNILHLISQYLIDFGLKRSQTALLEEANLANEYRVCDNIDLDTIYLDYCSYYQLRFGKQPKVLKKKDVTYIEKQTNGKQKSTKGATKQRLSESRSISNLSTENEKSVEIIQLADMISVSSLGIGQAYSTADIRDTLVVDVGKMNRLREDFLDNLSTEMKELAQVIERDIVNRDYNIKWSDVQGNDEAKLILQESVVHPCEYPELFKGIVRPWKGILLHGPPGIGKTMLAKALSSETFGMVTFFNIACSTIISKWRGESEKFIRILFRMAKAYAPSVIFIDEFECLATKRDSPGEHEASKRFKNEFLIQIDDLDCGIDNGNVLLLANSNLPWEIDAAFLRRFERKILIDLPDENVRQNIIRHWLPSTAIKWSEVQMNAFAQLTNGFSGADIKVACKEATMKQIRAAIKANVSQHQSVDVTLDDLCEALNQIQPTMVPLAEKHRIWHQKFGSKIYKLK